MVLLNRYVAVLLVGFIVFGCSKKMSEQELWADAGQLEKQEQFEQAAALYDQLYQNYPKGEHAEEAVQKSAFLYYNNFKDFTKAIERHELLLKTYPDSKFVPQARFMIGFIYANDLTDYDMARHYYNEFLEKHPDNELVASVKWELEHLGKDVNEQLKELFEGDQTSGGSRAKK